SFATEDDGVALRTLPWIQMKKGIARWFFWNATETVEDYKGRTTKRKKDVRRDNERVLTIVQGPESKMEVGQRVFLIVQANGRSRVILDNSGTGIVNAKPTPTK
ncbi:MAG: hypothetical protein ACKO57_02170, partial [Alphaproteobacteria bacterium]